MHFAFPQVIDFPVVNVGRHEACRQSRIQKDVERVAQRVEASVGVGVLADVQPEVRVRVFFAGGGGLVLGVVLGDDVMVPPTASMTW